MASLQPVFIEIFEVKIGGCICLFAHPPLLHPLIVYKFLAILPFMLFE